MFYKWYEVVIIYFLVACVLFVGGAVAIEMDTGKPAKIAIHDWLTK